MDISKKINTNHGYQKEEHHSSQSRWLYGYQKEHHGSQSVPGWANINIKNCVWGWAKVYSVQYFNIYYSRFFSFLKQQQKTNTHKATPEHKILVYCTIKILVDQHQARPSDSKTQHVHFTLGQVRQLKQTQTNTPGLSGFAETCQKKTYKWCVWCQTEWMPLINTTIFCYYLCCNTHTHTHTHCSYPDIYTPARIYMNGLAMTTYLKRNIK